MTPDINVLLAAFRLDHAHHAVARSWLEDAIASAGRGDRLSLLPMVIAGFVRLATNQRVFPDPAPVTAAVKFLEAIIEAPGVEIASLGQEWPALRRQLLTLDVGGNSVPDAWIAAAVQTSGDHLVTFDRGFKGMLARSELTLLKTQ